MRPKESRKKQKTGAIFLSKLYPSLTIYIAIKGPIQLSFPIFVESITLKKEKKKKQIDQLFPISPAVKENRSVLQSDWLALRHVCDWLKIIHEAPADWLLD